MKRNRSMPLPGARGLACYERYFRTVGELMMPSWAWADPRVKTQAKKYKTQRGLDSYMARVATRRGKPVVRYNG